MKQIVLNIPDSSYTAFISHLKKQFSEIQIREKKVKKNLIEEGSTFEIMLLSENSLAKDWLSEEDNRWDELL